VRDRLLTEINNLGSGDDAASWAHRNMCAKNGLAALEAGASRRPSKRDWADAPAKSAGPIHPTVNARALWLPNASRSSSPEKPSAARSRIVSISRRDQRVGSQRESTLATGSSTDFRHDLQ
jgi:hypothetical protein